MAVKKVSVRKFLHRLGDYAQPNKAVTVTKHGRAIGIYIPLYRKPASEDLSTFREAGFALRALMAEKGVNEDQVVEDFNWLRKAGRKARG